MSEKRKIGVFICHCGGNISDFVDVEELRASIEEDPDVVVAKTTMFACSDSAQQEIAEAIEKEGLDGIVVASCSPKLHLYTFRGMAERAGLNPYRYVQVNLREQCSWAHRDNKQAATIKGESLLRAGKARAAASKSLENFRIETLPTVLVIGAGVAGLRAAIGLADLGLAVHLVEKADKPGGWVASLGPTFPTDRKGSDLIQDLLDQVRKRENIALYTGAEVVERSGSAGKFQIKIRLSTGEKLTLAAGAVIVATGFDSYAPEEGEFGYGLPGVITMPDFRRMLDETQGKILYNGRKVKTIAYVYCVGSRQAEDETHAHCSRYCCTATVHTALQVTKRDPKVNQYHLYRDMRTYGKYELLFEEASRKGSVFMRWDPDNPPEVRADKDRLAVSVADLLDGGDRVEIPVDLTVLVTAMVPRSGDHLVDTLKLPTSKSGFLNEIHPKLRPVETVINGMLIAGAAQGPKTISEAVSSSLAAVTKSAALLVKGYVDLEPFVAKVDAERCTGCGECVAACPYEALQMRTMEKREIAEVTPSLCKAGGACVPACPEGALDLVGYTDREITAMIDALAREPVHA
ncbi:MAG TPA: CoB--CoM heterodisulfide reductase iron-sulfur subunit A family protein [Fimbriimonadaceae bacterium]|nr:CoB--CoM heterodisulfide reductase iron-sulfur subunit A family protein [Fimbriimonadaceae bacterium]